MVTILSEFHSYAAVGAEAPGETLWVQRARPAPPAGKRSRKGSARARPASPIPAGREQEFIRDGHINVAALCGATSVSLVLHSDPRRRVGSLARGAGERGAALASLDAPDFALPDLADRVHRLSDYRGRKVLLVTWASW